MSDQHHAEQKKNQAAIMYEKSHGQMGASMEQQAARAQAEKVAQQAEWCKIPQSIRDSAANEDQMHGPHVRDSSCDKPRGGHHR